MDTEDNLAILEKLDRKGARVSRNATLVAWMSVAGAAAVMALLIYLGNQQLQQVRSAADAERQRLQTLQEQSAKLTLEIKKQSEEIQNLKPLAQNYEALRQTQRAAVEPAPPPPPVTGTPGKPIPPRVYLQIVNQADREYAKRMGVVLQKAGFTVPGIEYVGKAAGLRNTEVRYYKKVEEPEAKRVADLLRAETRELIALLYLGLENAKVRERHYEVWFRAQDR